MASTTHPPAPHGISLAELVALAGEMAALARCGVPLERGLKDVARDLSGPSGRVAAALAGRLQGGESLRQIIATSPALFPPTWRAVVESGIRTGRLATALEGLARAGRRVAEMRRLTRAAMLYPLCVALLAYSLFVFSITRFQPRVRDAYEAMRVPENPLNASLVKLGESAGLWGPWIPLAIVGLLAVWWYRSARAAPAWHGWWARLFPAARLLRYGRLATFADVLALLVDHEAPLGESIVLAAEASSDAALAASAAEMAAAIARGDRSVQGAAQGFPALVSWLLLSGGQQGSLADSLRQLAVTYRRRANHLENWIRLYLPLGLSLSIGGAAVVLYALSVLVPWYGMLFELGTPR